jgi:hypothetical protein
VLGRSPFELSDSSKINPRCSQRLREPQERKKRHEGNTPQIQTSAGSSKSPIRRGHESAIVPPLVPERRSARSVTPQMVGAGPVEPGRRDAPMLLRVHVIEARGLPAIYLNGSSDLYVRLQLGHRRPRATTVVNRSLSPVWDEEFGFLVGDVAEELVISVLNEDRFFSKDFLGRVRVPLTAIMETEDLSLGTAWYPLQPRKGGKFRRKRRGTPPCMYPTFPILHCLGSLISSPYLLALRLLL